MRELGRQTILWYLLRIGFNGLVIQLPNVRIVLKEVCFTDFTLVILVAFYSNIMIIRVWIYRLFVFKQKMIKHANQYSKLCLTAPEITQDGILIWRYEMNYVFGSKLQADMYYLKNKRQQSITFVTFC